MPFRSPDFSALERGQVAQLKVVRAARDGVRVEAALAALRRSAAAYAIVDAAREPLMPLIIDAVRARASVGEISDTFAAVWGSYRPK